MRRWALTSDLLPPSVIECILDSKRQKGELRVLLNNGAYFLSAVSGLLAT
jgi:hypothetical protein